MGASPMQFERSDPQDPHYTNFVAGDEVWLRGAWRIPDPNAISWSRLMNLIAFTEGSSDYYTGLVVEGSSAQMQITTRTYSGSVSKPIFPARPIPVDRWFEVVLHFKLSPTDGQALNKWYIDGQRVASNTNANMVNSQPFIGYQGGMPYFSSATAPGTVVYFDNPGLAYPE